MQKPTIYEIKRSVIATSPYFFDRQTMRFFNQTMKDFTVVKSPTDRIFLYAPVMDEDRKIRFYTFREYTDGKLTNNLRPIHNTVEAIHEYIHTH